MICEMELPWQHEITCRILRDRQALFLEHVGSHLLGSNMCFGLAFAMVYPVLQGFLGEEFNCQTHYCQLPGLYNKEGLCGQCRHL